MMQAPMYNLYFKSGLSHKSFAALKLSAKPLTNFAVILQRTGSKRITQQATLYGTLAGIAIYILQPPGPPKHYIDKYTQRNSAYHYNRVTIVPPKFRHKIKIHSVEASYHGWHSKNSCPPRKFS